MDEIRTHDKEAPLNRRQTQFWGIAPAVWRREASAWTGCFRIDAADGGIGEVAALALDDQGPEIWQIAAGRWIVAAGDILMVVEFTATTPVIVTVYPARPRRDEIAA